MVNPHTFAIHRSFPHRVDTELSRAKRWNGLHVHHINNSVFSTYLPVVCFLQILLHSVQCLSAVLPDSATSPAAGAVPPPGPLPQAGGPKFGGCVRPGPQLEGWTHDASDTAVLSSVLWISPVLILSSLMLDSWGWRTELINQQFPN